MWWYHRLVAGQTNPLLQNSPLTIESNEIFVLTIPEHKLSVSIVGLARCRWAEPPG
jgi:hypothetical protein